MATVGMLSQDNSARINSLDFHRREDLLVTAGDDDSIHLYNTTSGTQQKTVFSRKYGVAHITFTHHPQSIVYASNKVSAAAEVLQTTHSATSMHAARSSCATA